VSAPGTSRSLLSGVGSELLKFGKYRGLTFDEVFEMDSGYCRWVLRITECGRNGCRSLRRFACYLCGPHSRFSLSLPTLTTLPPPPPPALTRLEPTHPPPSISRPSPKKRKRDPVFPAQIFRVSAFLELYSRRSPRPTSLDCYYALRGNYALEGAATDFARLPPGDIDALNRYSIKLWVCLRGREKDRGGIEFYKILNDAVIADDVRALRPLIPIARVLTSIITDSSLPHEVTTYRGSRMSVEQFEALLVGREYRVAMFVASSVQLRVAQRFASDGAGIIVEFRIPTACCNAGFLGVEHLKQDECEFLMAPYSVVEIEKKTTHGTFWRLTVRVAKDKREHSLGLESILL